VTFYSLSCGPELRREGLALWRVALRLAVKEANEVLAQLPGRAERTCGVGQAVLGTVALLAAVRERLVFYLAARPPFGATVAQDRIAVARADLAARNTFDAAPLLEELHAAILFDARHPDEKSVWCLPSRPALSWKHLPWPSI
jgi:hypothetical protein